MATPVGQFGVVRWNVDADGRPTMVVKCPGGWCEIGEIGFHSLALPIAATNSGEFDTQIVSIPAGTNVQPSNVVATISPLHVQNGHKKAGFKCAVSGSCTNADYKPVAIIDLPARIPDYYTKYKLDMGRTKLLLRYDQAIDEWQAATQPMAGGAIYKTRIFVHFHKHAKLPRTPEVARWKWSDKDETMWVRCANGCCEVSDQETEK